METVFCPGEKKEEFKMKKATILVITIAVVVAIIFGGCRAAQGPSGPTPEGPATAADVPELVGLCRPDLPMNYGPEFAFKPDGTPYEVAVAYVVMNCEEMVNYEGVQRTNFGRAGMEYSAFDSQFNADVQIAYLEDLASVNPPDFCVIQPVNEMAVVPSADKLAATGTQIYTFDLPLFTQNVNNSVHHWFEGPASAGGGGLIGEKWVEIAEATNQELNILEIWCMRSALFSQQRHASLWNYVKDNPMINVVESIDNGGSEEITAQIVIDNFTADPSMNGIYMQCGGQAGVISGLRSIDRLLPIGDPNHVTVITFEGALPVMQEMEKGNIDYVMTHGPWDVCDTLVKVVLWNGVCNVDLPQNIVPPMYLLDKDTLNNPNNFMYGALYWTQMPAARWDLWPILDTGAEGSLVLLPADMWDFYYGDYTRWQLGNPSLEARQANAGY
jgi:ABC-type sugar transport system substrate-binding protein